MKVCYMMIGAALAAGVAIGIKKNREHDQNSEDIKLLKDYLIMHPIPSPEELPEMVDLDVK